MLVSSVVASATRTHLRMKDILRLCAYFLYMWCLSSRWIAGKYLVSIGNNSFSILICLKLDLVILCFSILFTGKVVKRSKLVASCNQFIQC